ncbi:CPBP family intramembrane glutamic endopeptidase [Poriferisphaera sp. WC338]|uniref:CPBP family intramembrane glutamic endopeptidase n=1 Tax=Poriferisphaera sp. WC338 TaxID=3425129 RepID=UPI003D816887
MDTDTNHKHRELSEDGSKSHVRRAVIALLLLLPIPSLGTACGMYWLEGTAIGQGLFFMSKIWILLLPLVWHLWVDKQKISFSPMKREEIGKGLALAAVMGTVICAIIFGAYYGYAKDAVDLSLIKAKATEIGLDKPIFYIIAALYWITINSVLEEYVWRWFVFKKFETFTGGKIAIILSAFFFTVHHFIALASYFDVGLNLLCCFGIMVGGMSWSWLYLKYRSIWPGYLSHTMVDVAVFAIGYLLFFH